MSDMTEVNVLVSFPVCDNGFTPRSLEAGTQDKVPAHIFAGLEAEGLVSAIAAVASVPVDGGTGPLVIPDDWQGLHFMKQIALAKKISPDVKTKAEAIELLTLVPKPVEPQA